MKEIIENIQLVMNALQGISIISTADNMNKMLGSLQMLDKVVNKLIQMDGQKPQPEEEPEIQVEAFEIKNVKE